MVDLLYLLFYRYAVVVNGYEAIHEALVTKAHDFAGRGPLFIENHYMNPEIRGPSLTLTYS